MIIELTNNIDSMLLVNLNWESTGDDWLLCCTEHTNGDILADLILIKWT